MSSQIAANLIENTTFSLKPKIYHFRLATTGRKTLNNVHGWLKEGWEFYHNGTAFSYSDILNSELTDSLKFFKIILPAFQQLTLTTSKNAKQKHLQKIENISLTTGLTGRFLIANESRNEFYFFGDWRIYSINENYLIISSSTIELKTPQAKNSQVNLLGFTLKGEIEPIGFRIVQNWLEGVHYWLPAKSELVRLRKKFNDKLYSYPYAGQYNNNNYYDANYYAEESRLDEEDVLAKHNKAYKFKGSHLPLKDKTIGFKPR